MIQSTKIHTSCWWKWTFPCIMSWFLTVVTYHWSSPSSESSSCLSSTFVASSISSRHIILRFVIVLHGILRRLHYVVLCCAVLYGCCTVLYCCCAVLYGNGTWLKCGVACPDIISSCTLYVFDVLSHINFIVL
jgi:hypothetical protein